MIPVGVLVIVLSISVMEPIVWSEGLFDEKLKPTPQSLIEIDL